MSSQQAAFGRVSPGGDTHSSICLIGIKSKNVLKIDRISSRRANDELLQENFYHPELDFRLHLSQLEERKCPSTLYELLLWDQKFLLSH